MTEGSERYLDWAASPASDPALVRIEEQARADDVPIVGRRTAVLLYLAARMVRPRLIVELGAATGYSGIWLLRGWPQARLITFEVDERRAAQARDNFAAAGLGGRADVHVENAIEGLEELPSGSAGLVFNDLLNGLRDERRVERCFGEALRVLEPDGVLLADNALAGGDAATRATREGRCVHRWNELVREEPSLASLILPTEDGLSIAIRT